MQTLKHIRRYLELTKAVVTVFWLVLKIVELLKNL